MLSQDIFDAITDSERNVPYLRGSGRNAFGQPRSDALVVTEGWTKLQNFGIENGFVIYFVKGVQWRSISDIQVASLRTITTRIMISTTG